MEDNKKQTEQISNRSEKSERLGYILVPTSFFLLVLVILRYSSADYAQVLIFASLGLLATLGVFGIFAYFMGVLQFSGSSSQFNIAQLVVDSCPDGILVADSKGRVLFASDIYLNLTGQKGSVDPRSVERVFSGPAYISEAIYRLVQAAKDGRQTTEEIRITPSLDGKRSYAWYKISVTSQKRGRDVYNTWKIHDVTQERERQENVFQELQVAIDYLDHAPAGFFSLLKDGSVAYMNATLAGWLDYDLATISLPSFRATQIVSDDIATLLTTLSGEPGEARTDILDIDLRQRNGKSLPVRLYHRIAFGEDQQLGPSRTLVINRAMEQYNPAGGYDAEVKYSRLFNNAPLAIASVNDQARIVHANATFARLFNNLPRLQGNIEGFPIVLTISETQRAEFEAAIAEAASGRGDGSPLELQSAGENARSLRVWVNPITEEDSKEERVLIYALDRTELRQVEEQLAQAQKMNAVGQLAGGVAHDFNNVLQAIIGYCDLLLANHRPSDPSFQDIMQIKQNANRAAGLVRQLLAFSRRQTLRPQILNLSDMLSDLSHLLRRLLGEKVGLELRHGRELWPVLADMNQLETVVINLAVNARDAMLEGGQLTIRTYNLTQEDSASESVSGMPEGDYVVIEVADTGHGMTPEIREKIFEPFFTTKDIGKGTGLGLSTVFGIIKQSGGYIDVQSDIGQGTIFKTYLPRHVIVARKTEEDEHVAALPKPVADMTGQGVILLVEDDDPVRAVNGRALTARGYTVLEACSGAEALDIIDNRETPVDLVISDVVMPEMDGPTLLRELRKRFPELKVIFVSGYAEDAFKKNLAEGETFSFLAKPFSLKQFVETVKEVIGS